MAAKAGRASSSRVPKRGSKGGGPKRGKQPNAKRKLQKKRIRQEQGGSLPKRPDIKGLDGDDSTKKKKSRSGNKPHRKEPQEKDSRWHLNGRGREDIKPFAHKKQRGSYRTDKTEGAPEGQRKRKLANGQERLRALLDKHPDLLHAGETADAAVAACFKKTGRSQEEAGDDQLEGETTTEQQQQQLSGSKRRKLLRLVMNSRTADDKVFVHQAYQLYNDILRSIRTAEGPEGPPLKHANKTLKSRVAKAISFLEEPLARKDRHSCTARLAQICLKHADEESRAKLWEILFDDFVEFCGCKSFHHVAMKLFLYGTDEQKTRIVNKLASRKDIALTKFGATVWEYIYTAQKNSVAQQKLLNCLMLEPSVLVAVPKASECHSFSQVVALLSETQRTQALENVGNLVQKFVDKELLNKAHVHRITRGICSVASPEQLTAIWKTVAEGALHLATTKDGVEALVRLLGYASAKERKTVVKALKQHCVAFATNPVDSPLLLRLLMTVDDTKLLTDHIIKELMPAALQLAFDPYGHLVLLQLLHPEGICKQLPAHYQELLALPSPTSLKASLARQGELRPPVVAALSTAFAELPLDMEGKEQRSITEALKDGFASKVLVQLAQHPEAEAASLRVVAGLQQDLQKKSPSLTAHSVAQRTLSGLMKAGSPCVVKAAWTSLTTNLVSVLETKGIFVVLQVLKAARESKLTDLESEIRKQLDVRMLTSAEAAVAKAGIPATGIQILRKQLEC